MRRSIAAAAAVVTLTATLVACEGSNGGSDKAGPTGPTKGADSSSTTQPAGKQSPGATAGSTQAPVGKLGDTLKLVGMEGSLNGTGTIEADFTLENLENHAKSAIGALEPAAGNRLVAAKFTIVETGTGTYQDSGYAEAMVYDANGQGYQGKPGTPTVGKSLGGLQLIVKPGQRVSGWIVFEVPKDAKITSVTYVMEKVGPDPERTGKWTLD
ncbi:DUF4352 domain-containing protein [Streptomyces lonegramiae]|uniref:DUF4352 domain-containing protein n=1 Tax=Streptomyces lonegramiae TaxID=3075524 RepID=A0ABU2XPZ9_9ACTN|nr:DUF4352 domain-containing protein [Streptomyces sp. DSM 41529]MDT0547631.1 hypothetical protein [Streptomyces sp. DSM 41529]